MDTLFVTRGSSKASTGHHVSNLSSTKDYIYVVPMKKGSDVLQTVKQFVKVVNAPDAIIHDA